MPFVWSVLLNREAMKWTAKKLRERRQGHTASEHARGPTIQNKEMSAERHGCATYRNLEITMSLSAPSSMMNVVFLLLLKFFAAEATFSGMKDYCLTEGFHATCEADEVLVIMNAQYGRMAMGRCVTRDYGYIGCNADVTAFLTKFCSGKRECHIPNIEAFFEAYHTCPDDLKSYILASYECVKVTQADEEICNNFGFLHVKPPSGYIASVATEQHGFGSSQCPWAIRAQPGQRINITLIDFSLIPGTSYSTGEHGSMVPRYCREYATFRESEVINTVVVCDGDLPEKHIYITDSNYVEIEIEKFGQNDASYRFLLRYEVIGCPLPETPFNSYIQGDGDHIVVRCNYTTDAWHLTCRKGSWIGDVGNCSSGAKNKAELITSHPGFLPLGITVIIIIGVAFIICVITLIIGLVHLKKRRRAENGRSEDRLIYGTPRPEEARVDCPHRFATIDKGKQNYSPMKATLRTQMGGEYTHIWELRRPPCVVDPQMENEGNAMQEECAGCAGCKAFHSGEVIPLKEAVDSTTGLVTFKPSDHPHTHVYQSPRSASARQQQLQQQQLLQQQQQQQQPLRTDLPQGVLEHPFYFELDSKTPHPIQEETKTLKPSRGAESETMRSTSSC